MATSALINPAPLTKSNVVVAGSISSAEFFNKFLISPTPKISAPVGSNGGLGV